MGSPAPTANRTCERDDPFDNAGRAAIGSLEATDCCRAACKASVAESAWTEHKCAWMVARSVQLIFTHGN